MTERKAKPQAVACEVLRDFWDANGERQSKGKIVHLTVEEAFDGVENGSVKRVK